jgi:DNA ligase-1
VGHVAVLDAEELLAMHTTFLEAGFEGTMIRSSEGPYKRGRSTTKEGILLKLKAWEDEEATVVGVVEAMHNGNEATVDATGHTKRSTHAAGKTGKDTMGALLCRFPDGAEFGLGTGFTDAERRRIWLDRETFVGQRVKVRHQPDPGGRQPGQAPRIPSFLGFRHEDDR